MIRVEKIGNIFPGERGRAPFEALRDASFEVCKGEFVSIIGPSGCGKSTLLCGLHGLETASSGEVFATELFS